MRQPGAGRCRLVVDDVEQPLRPLLDRQRVIWCTTAYGWAAATAASTAPASNPSMTTGSAPSPANPASPARLVVVAVTRWPRATNCGTSRRPTTPVPPATNTRMTITA